MKLSSQYYKHNFHTCSCKYPESLTHDRDFAPFIFLHQYGSAKSQPAAPHTFQVNAPSCLCMFAVCRTCSRWHIPAFDPVATLKSPTIAAENSWVKKKIIFQIRLLNDYRRAKVVFGGGVSSGRKWGIEMAGTSDGHFVFPKQHFLYFLPLPHGHGSFRPTPEISDGCLDSKCFILQ